MVRVSLKDLRKSSNINGLQAASKAFVLYNLKMAVPLKFGSAALTKL